MDVIVGLAVVGGLAVVVIWFVLYRWSGGRGSGAVVAGAEVPEEQAVMTRAAVARTATVSLGRFQTIAACFQSLRASRGQPTGTG